VIVRMKNYPRKAHGALNRGVFLAVEIN
jgi:hypothetical protein